MTRADADAREAWLKERFSAEDRASVLLTKSARDDDIDDIGDAESA
jgi:hypothetical protein